MISLEKHSLCWGSKDFEMLMLYIGFYHFRPATAVVPSSKPFGILAEEFLAADWLINERSEEEMLRVLLFFG